MKEKLRRAVHILSVLGMAVCLCAVLYPVFGGLVNSLQHHGVVSEYRGAAEKTDTAESGRLLQEAERWNADLYGRGAALQNLPQSMDAVYREVLKIPGTDSIGYIRIPKIDVLLPVYHGTDEDVLNAGVGHLSGSSIPAGGANTHAVLTGHSGLPSQKLFTDLDQLEPGDRFTVTVLNRTLTYQVRDSEILLPEEIELNIEPGEDLCTLITCVPVSINTHRLLVHGVRVADTPSVPGGGPAAEVEEPEPMTRVFVRTIFLLALTAVLGTAFLIFTVRLVNGKRPGRKSGKKEGEQDQERGQT